MLSVETFTGPPAGPPGETAPPPPIAPDDPGGARVVGGVANELGMRLGLDPLWVRLAFVGLTVAGGLGAVLYVALWFVLVVGRRPDSSPVPWSIAAVVVVVAWAASDAPDDMRFEWPLGWAIVLGGGALALWQPRSVVEPRMWRAGDLSARSNREDGPVHVDGDPASDRTLDADGDVGGRHERRRLHVPLPRRRRQPSPLGRAVLGLALVVSAGGAMIDQLNDGRLHPEQWLGAATAVCGVGLLVGAWRGRAWWLVVPALMFAGSGFVAGHAARAGVDELTWGDTWMDVGEGTAPGSVLTERRVVGTANVSLYAAPVDEPAGEPVRVDVAVGMGRIVIVADDEVTVQIRPHVDDGEVRVNRHNGRVEDTTGNREVVTIGPDGGPDVIVEARISHGDLFVNQQDILSDGPNLVPPHELPGQASAGEAGPPWFDGNAAPGVTDIGEGLQMASDGTVLFPDAVGALGPDGELWTASAVAPRDDGVTVITTGFGDFLVLPNQLIISPQGLLVDSPRLRDERAAVTEATTAPVSELPSSTVPLSSIPDEQGN